ncbi:MAG TPA: serine protease [Gemmata sp.]
MRVAFLMCVGLLISDTARADDAIPPKVLADLKAGTVFVRVQTERGKATGSGFVVAAGGGSALIITNRHVIAPKTIGAVTGVQVVFHSGKPGSEVTLDAKVLVADADQDLAVLEVSGAKEVPKPLDITTAVEAFETMSVYSFGFPFGEALSTTKGNPALTVGRASVSSLRQNDKGVVAAIQLDGNLNPGNSGGPIVDGKGRVVGVAVAGVRGAGIGLAIPRAEVTRLLARQGAQLSVRPGAPKDGKVEVELSLMVLDPSQKVTAVRVRVVRANDVPKDWGKDRSGGPPALPGGDVVELKLDGFRARGRVTLKANKPETVAHLFQSALVGPDGSKPSEPISASINFDPNASRVAGHWTRVTEGITELWSVRRAGDTWEVYGAFLENGKEVGGFVGTDVKVTEKTLTFVQKFAKPPPRLWLSGATVTATAEGDKFAYTWRLHGSSGTRDMTRPRLEVQAGPAKDGKVEVDLSLMVLNSSPKAPTVRVRVVRAADVPKGTAGALAGGEVVDLKVDGHVAHGIVTLKADKPDAVQYLFQTIVAGPDGDHVAAAIPTDINFDPKASGIGGQWTRVTEGLTELWTVRFVDGKWEVSGIYLENDKEVGSFVGSDVKVTGKTVTFIQKFVKAPRVWLSGATVTATAEGDKFTYTWRLGGSSGTREMTRAKR